MITKQRALELLSKMPKKWKVQTDHLTELVNDGKLREAYLYINYGEAGGIEYVMRDSLWTYFIANQSMGLVDNQPC